MKKYLIVGVSLRSRGGEAMVFEACKKIKEIDEDNEISMATLNFHYDLNFLKKVQNPYKINVLDLASLRHSSNRYINFGLNYMYTLYDVFLVLLSNKLLKYLNIKLNYKTKLIRYIDDTDIIIQIAGISFTENFGVFNAMNWAKQMFLAKIMNKKYFCLPQSYGPSGKLIKFFAKIGLNQVTHIMPRGQKSIDYLKSLNLKNKNITFVPDLAFAYYDLLENEDEIYKKIKIDVSHKYIALIPNTHLYNWRGQEIIRLFSEIIDYLIDTYNYYVILIAHEVNDDNIIDDRFANNLIYEKCVNKKSILNITDELRANEIKSLIKLCDFTICSRFHGMISSLKMKVPPLIIGWADKYYEIMELFNLENLVMDYRDLNRDKIIKKINFLLANKLNIVEMIDKNLSKYKNSSDMVRKIIELNL